MNQYIFLDGEQLNQDFPLRSIFYGEGVFETFRWKGALPGFWNLHMARMKRGSEFLHVPLPQKEYLKRRVDEALARSGIQDAYIKICLLSKGSTVFHDKPEDSSVLVTVKEHKSYPEPIKACISSLKRHSGSPIVRIKSLNYLENILARREALSRGFDEAIFLNQRGEVAEGSASNLFWENNGVLFTPSFECGILPGITRSTVIDVAKESEMEVREGKFDLGSLISSNSAFITNSSIGAIPISLIDEVKMDPDSSQIEKIKHALSEKLGWRRKL